MVKMSLVYQGELHCELTHEPSGSKVETDAPKDNAGRGEKFSPTDLVGAALASCVVTTMAIVGERHGLKLHGMRARVSKEMTPAPRMIASLPVEVDMPAGLSPEDRKRLENSAHTCPVHRSLATSVNAPITFIYPD
jgi:putative redox protein